MSREQRTLHNGAYYRMPSNRVHPDGAHKPQPYNQQPRFTAQQVQHAERYSHSEYSRSSTYRPSYHSHPNSSESTIPRSRSSHNLSHRGNHAPSHTQQHYQRHQSDITNHRHRPHQSAHIPPEHTSSSRVCCPCTHPMYPLYISLHIQRVPSL